MRFILRNQFVADAAPADAAREQRCNKVREIQIRYEDADGDVNPGLRVNLHAIKRQEIGDSDDAEGAAQRSEQQGKKSERREMERRTGGENVSKGEDEAEDKSEAEERMRCKSGGPHFVSINASDENLAIREFEESFEGRVCERNDETFGQELNGFAAAREGIGHRVVVADGTLPFFEHTTLIKFRFANGSAATPAEVAGFFAEHGDDGRVPRGQQQRRKIGCLGIHLA